jgi:hypothetical protein
VNAPRLRTWFEIKVRQLLRDGWEVMRCVAQDIVVSGVSGVRRGDYSRGRQGRAVDQ